MLRIREKQVEAFQQAALRIFEADRVRHLEMFSPKYCEVIGEEGRVRGDPPRH